MADQLPLKGEPGREPKTNVPEYSVSEISFALKRVVENTFGHVRLRGEISGYRGPHSSGHAYFTLKDEKARIEAVIWRGVFSRLRFKPEEGLEIVATGKLSTYPGSSKYQIVIERLEPAGVGALMALLEERKKKLAKEGLFDEDRKKELPFLPDVVGIVTSPTGAVIRDMLHGFDERFPVHVVVWPVRVQGETCGAEVAAAIRGFNALADGSATPKPDVLIVARGGGSLEDLWGFNEEEVARAAAESTIPLISAVGHETDWTLIDLVADARAPTPTKAAEWAVPNFSDLLDRNIELDRRLKLIVRRLLEDRRIRLGSAARGLPKLQDLLALPRQRLDAAGLRLAGGLRHTCQSLRSKFQENAARLSLRTLSTRIDHARERLGGFSLRSARAYSNGVTTQRERLNATAKLLETLSYQSVLARGFALVRGQDGMMLRRAAEVKPDEMLEIEFADGRVPATADNGKPATKRTARSAPRKPNKKKPISRKRPRFDPSGQGSLF